MQSFVFKVSIVDFTLLLHKQITHHLNYFCLRNPMSLVSLSSKKACENYGALFKRQCKIYVKRNAESDKYFDMNKMANFSFG